MRHLQQLRYMDAVARIGSIRRAADKLAITSLALNRHILAVEEDLGTPIFQRIPIGVWCSVADELFIQHVRQQLSDMQRVQSQIADLSGERRAQFPLALPSQHAVIRHVLERAAARRSVPLNVSVESDSASFLLECLHTEPMLAFQIPVAFIGRGPVKNICAVPVHVNDVPLGGLQLIQKRGRTLPVAAARFASSISDGLLTLVDQ